jgi:flagella basal body P-ring formation protein FlgA
MSVVLFTGEVTISAAGTVQLVAPGNYIVSALSIMVGEVVAAASGNAAFQAILQSGSGGGTGEFITVRGQGAATAAGQVLVPGTALSASNIEISFPDFLILQRGEAISVQTTTFTNITAATLILTLWGLITQ